MKLSSKINSKKKHRLASTVIESSLLELAHVFRMIYNRVKFEFVEFHTSRAKIEYLAIDSWTATGQKSLKIMIETAIMIVKKRTNYESNLMTLKISISAHDWQISG